MADRFDAERHLRIHRSHIVCRDRIAAIKRRPAGGYTIVTDAGEVLPVGRSYRGVVRELLGKSSR